MNINIMGIFPTPIGKINIGRELSSLEKDFIYNQNTKENDVGVVKHSKNARLLDDDILYDLKTFIEESSNAFFQEISNPSTNVCLKITQSWSNYGNTNQFDYPHFHLNSIISGAFYVNTNENSDRIVFNKDTAMMPYHISPKEYNIWNSNNWEVPAEEGILLLFPSTLVHKVPHVVGKKQRISISFNTFFSGEIGSYENLTQLFI